MRKFHWPKLSLNLVLGGLAFAALLPALIFAIVQANRSVTVKTEAFARDARELTERLKVLVERLTTEREALLIALSASADLKTGNLEAFHKHAKSIMDENTGAILLSNRAGRIILSTDVPSASPMPEPRDTTTTQRAIASGRIEISDMFLSPFTNRPTSSLAKVVPETDFVLRISLRKAWLNDQLQHAAPPGWVLAVTDRAGIIAARSREADQWVGQKATANALENAERADRGWIRSTNVEGVPTRLAWQKLAFGWTVWAGVEDALYSAPPREAVRELSLAIALSIVISLVMAALTAAFLGMPLKKLSIAAEALGNGLIPEMTRTNVRELDILGRALVDAANSRKKKIDHVQFLLGEVNHRAKNMLLVVQAIAIQTARENPSQFSTVLSERLSALATCQDLLVQSRWEGIELHNLVQSQLGHVADMLNNRIWVRGRSLTIRADATQTLGMALHELVTNASKYGALSNPTGQVSISWCYDPTSRKFDLLWSETGGPQAAPPSKEGFGATVLRKVPELEFDAVVTLDYPIEGLTWRMSCPGDSILVLEPSPVST